MKGRAREVKHARGKEREAKRDVGRGQGRNRDGGGETKGWSEKERVWLLMFLN